MRRRILIWIVVLGLLGVAGCGKTETEVQEPETEQAVQEPETEQMIQEPETEQSITEPEDEPAQTDPVSEDNNDMEWADQLEVDFTYDYSEDIKADVDRVAAESATLQEELENMEKVVQKYTPLSQAARTQMEMNISSGWFFTIWDTELNSLWSRFSSSADPQTKEKLLAEQRNWIDMKEEAILLSLGPREEHGSIYPLLENTLLEDFTKNRAYVLTNELAKVEGESFVMPEKSVEYGGLFVDNQGTGTVYSSLNMRGQGEAEEGEAVISVYRLGETEGSFVDSGDGELDFTSYDGNVKGIIQINGWDGAGFTVTETSEGSPFSVGEEYQFPFAF